MHAGHDEAALRGRRDASPAAWAAVTAFTAVAAWGAGLIQLALGAGVLTASDGGRAVGVPLVLLGSASIAWGAAALARGRVIAPRASVAGVLSGIAATAVAVWVDPARTSVIAAGAASLLLLAVGIVCGRAIRGRGTDAAPPRVGALLLAAVLVAGVVTPALAATEAGRLGGGGHGVVQGGHAH
ncbi:hypothetical protein ABZ477_14930 [Microbacterium sp. NPDC019599]|uniref:hypothetical protein n=1 Tax=Microbacterium sp. NPDC019599 TaxID=3154690 RepID=UPI0034103331